MTKYAKMTTADYRKYKSAQIPDRILEFRMPAMEALNTLDDLVECWKEKVLDKGSNAKIHLETIEGLRKVYLKRLLGEMQPKVQKEKVAWQQHQDSYGKGGLK